MLEGEGALRRLSRVPATTVRLEGKTLLQVWRRPSATERSGRMYPTSANPVLNRKRPNGARSAAPNVAQPSATTLEVGPSADLCKSCIEQEKAKWREKRCGKCGTTIRYERRVGRVPTSASHASNRRRPNGARNHAPGAALRSATALSGIGCPICANPASSKRRPSGAKNLAQNAGPQSGTAATGKEPNLCKACAAQEKANWQEKPCARCGASIRYNVGWERIPDLCRPCIEQEKAKWREKRCAKCALSATTLNGPTSQTSAKHVSRVKGPVG